MKSTLCLFAMLFYIFIGALEISSAVKEYKEGRYFRFGWSCMFAFSMCACILNLFINI